MPLTGKEIFDQGFIPDGTQAQIRDASYDLSVDRVIRGGKENTENVLRIMPQEIVILVSRETVSVKPGHVGYAMPKTTLCNRGILALNTGIVDPGYKGKLSSTAINFCAEPVELKRGESFLRLVFHKLTKEVSTENIIPDDAYMKDRRYDSKFYPDTFLNLHKTIEEISNKIVAKETNRLLTVLTWATVLIGIFAVVVAIYTLVFPDIHERKLSDQSRRIEKMTDTIRELEETLTKFKALEEQEHKQSAETKKKKNQ